MLDSITLTRVPGSSGTPDSWTVAITSAGKNGSFSIVNISTTIALTEALAKLLATMDAAINLGAGTLSFDASKI